MKLGIRQKGKLFSYLQELDWQKEPDPVYMFCVARSSYVAVDTDNRLVYKCGMTEDYGIYSTPKEYRLEISRPGTSVTEVIKGKFAKKVFDWVKENVYVVGNEIKQMAEDVEEEERVELESIVKGLIK